MKNESEVGEEQTVRKNVSVQIGIIYIVINSLIHINEEQSVSKHVEHIWSLGQVISPAFYLELNHLENLK